MTLKDVFLPWTGEEKRVIYIYIYIYLKNPKKKNPKKLQTITKKEIKGTEP